MNSDELKLLNSTTLDVDGAGTFAGSVTATSITTNDIASNGSNADITITPAGTGNIKNRWNKKALEDDNKFLSEQEKIEASETQANQ